MPPTLREIAPEFFVFDCDRLRAAISPTACKDNFTNRRCLACINCPIGIEFSGGEKSPVPKLDLLDQCRWRRCIRCDQTVPRVMLKSFCPSCWNRSLEVCHGRNTKGAWPHRVASQLKRIYAVIQGEPAEVASFASSPKASTIPIKFSQLSSNALWLDGIFSDVHEVDKMLTKILPTGFISDFEESEIARSSLL